ncbi:MAG: FtsQ-type POTRA domain-containing protein [Parcubacteria group bacterium]
MIYKRKKYPTVSRNHSRGFLQFLFWFALIAFFGVVGYVLFFSSFLTVTSLRISGEKNVSEEKLLERVKPEISGYIWKFISRNNLFLVRKSIIQKNISENFRQIKGVEVRKRFPSELEVIVSERIPTMLFQGANGWFILDENAVAYDSVDPAAEEIVRYDLPRLVDLDGKSVALGETVLNGDYVTYVLGIKEKMKSDTEIMIGSDFQTPSLISKDIRAKTQEGWGIYFNENINLDKEIEMLNAVLNHEIEKKQRPDLEYIDLRIDNKVYYKFREGTPEETARLAATAADQAATDAATQPVVPVDDSGKKKKK